MVNTKEVPAVVYVRIRKITTSDSHVEYEFGPNEERVGRIQIDRVSGEIEVLADVPDDTNSFYAIRAARKLTLHFRYNEFPDRTCFAS